jgi:hypothetical protein
MEQLEYWMNSIEVNVAIEHDYVFVLHHVNEDEDDNQYDIHLLI